MDRQPPRTVKIAIIRAFLQIVAVWVRTMVGLTITGQLVQVLIMAPPSKAVQRAHQQPTLPPAAQRQLLPPVLQVRAAGPHRMDKAVLRVTAREGAALAIFSVLYRMAFSHSTPLTAATTMPILILRTMSTLILRTPRTLKTVRTLLLLPAQPQPRLLIVHLRP